MKTCRACKRSYSLVEFVTTSGKIAPSCSACRHQWHRRQQAKWARKIAEAGQKEGKDWRKCARCNEPFPIEDFRNQHGDLIWRCPDCVDLLPGKYVTTKERTPGERRRAARGYVSSYRKVRG